MKYDFEKIEKLRSKYEHLPFKEKWEEIGTAFDKTGSAVHRWYYRQLKNSDVNNSDEKPDIKTDTIRTVYFLLYNKVCRLPQKQAITEIKTILDKL